MKRLDLHVHTTVTEIDHDFNYSLEKLKRYVETVGINAIAITNHNIFNLNNFFEIKKGLNCIVFPGIEISMKPNGHLLLIAKENTEIEFNKKCLEISNVYNTNHEISVEDLFDIFGDLNQYLLIPHYDKNPKVTKPVLEQLKEYIDLGEVSSPKKWLTCINDLNSLIPVIFSDFREYEEEVLPSKQTFFDINEITLSNIKLASKDRKKISLTPVAESKDFLIAGGKVLASSRLNVILGERSSGKTYTLNSIEKDYRVNGVKYIKQFQLVGKSEDSVFKEIINRNNDEERELILKDLSDIVNLTKNIDIPIYESQIEDYLISLKNYAENIDKKDIFSKCKIFVDGNLDSISNVNNKKAIDGYMTSYEDENIRKIVADFLVVDKIPNVVIALISNYEQVNLKNKQIEVVNQLVRDIKTKLGNKSTIKPIKDVNFKDYLTDYLRIKKFNEVVDLVNEEIEIKSIEENGFKLRTTIKRIKSADELNKIVHTKNTKKLFESWFKGSNTITHFDYMKVALNNVNNINLDLSNLYKIFWHVKYEVLNDYGKQLSGGEKAEYNFIEELKDAYKYDVVLLDEPESSFDNLFLKDNIIDTIKKISEKSTVFVVTHNNTVGVSLNPDRVLYAMKEKVNDESKYHVFSGRLDDKKMITYDSIELNTYDVLMETMEAGEISYKERGKIYGFIKD